MLPINAAKLGIVLPILGCAFMALGQQYTIHNRQSSGWSVELSRNWDVLGPFPIHAREQHYLSPSFPLNLSESINFEEKWPSSYADNGIVGWSNTTADEGGDLRVSFPNVRWSSLRATEGWAAFQHHAILRTTLKVRPPSSGDVSKPPPLLVHLKQGSFFTILDKPARTTPNWYAGNIYAMGHVLPRIVPLPTEPSGQGDTEYDMFVSGDYEIRLFGDPSAYNSEVPIQSLNIQVVFDDSSELVVHEPNYDVVPDFVEGYAFGTSVGIGFRSTREWLNVTNVTLTNGNENFSARLLHPLTLAPSQTRVIPMEILQKTAFNATSLDLDISLGDNRTTHVSIPITHTPIWTPSNYTSFKATYMFAGSMPTAFVVTPPRLENNGEPKAVLLALHGAGVDNLRDPFWADALARQEQSWIVMPTGRTPWGLDWHGPSATDAWNSVEALSNITSERDIFQPWKTRTDTPVILLGHSNGGQGAWYLASRYPDRVLAVAPAAAYIKSQQYVPWTMSRSAHYFDPALQAVLDTSLMPDNNDLFLTNLVSTPVLAIHGGIDNNVPTWHSRELVSVLKYWYPKANVTLREEAGQNHWYDTVLKNDQFQDFVEDTLVSSHARIVPSDFILTVSIPSSSGSLHGFSILEPEIQGLLGRLHVQHEDGDWVVLTRNVKSFSVDWTSKPFKGIKIDQTSFSSTAHSRYTRTEEGWVSLSSNPTGRQAGRMQEILNTSGVITFVVPDGKPSTELSIALRLAHDLLSYHKLDSQIVVLSQLGKNTFNLGNLVLISKKPNPGFSSFLEQGPISIEGDNYNVNGQKVLDSNAGFIFLRPSPFGDGLALFLLSGSSEGLERATRLFPTRTGVAIPDWVVTGPKADIFGAGGIYGAGVYGSAWSWNNQLSWLYV